MRIICVIVHERRCVTQCVCVSVCVGVGGGGRLRMVYATDYWCDN